MRGRTSFDEGGRALLAAPIARTIRALTSLQVTRPWIPLLFAALVTAAAVWLALGLEVRTGFESLLPESRPSVVELRRVSRHVAGVSSLFIVLEGGEQARPEALRTAGDRLVDELTKLGPPWVGAVEDGVHEA